MLAMNYKNFRKYRNILKVVLLEKEPDFLERCNSGEKAEIEQRVEDFRYECPLRLLLFMCFSLPPLFQQEKPEPDGVVCGVLPIFMVMGIIELYLGSLRREGVCVGDHEILLCAAAGVRELHRVWRHLFGIPFLRVEGLAAVFLCGYSQLPDVTPTLSFIIYVVHYPERTPLFTCVAKPLLFIQHRNLHSLVPLLH